MPPKRKTANDPLDILDERISNLEGMVGRLKNNKVLTVSIYDPTNFPTNSVEGQIAAGNDDSLWEFTNGAWHKIGGSGTASTPDFAIGKVVKTIVKNTTTNLWPLDSFVTGNPAIFEKDVGNGYINCLVSGFYEMSANVVVFSGNALTARISLDVPFATNDLNGSGGDNSGMLDAFGIFGNINGTPGVSNQWQLSYKTYYNIATPPSVFAYRAIATTAANDWVFATSWIAVRRLSDAAPAGTNLGL